jgi:hypothetical protein
MYESSKNKKTRYMKRSKKSSKKYPRKSSKKSSKKYPKKSDRKSPRKSVRKSPRKPVRKSSKPLFYMKASNPKTVLVICSTVSGSDFPKNENQTMLKQLLGDDFIAEFMGQYPDDLPTDKKFDAVLFAGCNLLMWLFYKAHEDGMEKLYNILKQDGIVIFVESQNYINKTVTKGKSYGLSIPIEEMKLYGLKQYNDSEIKQKILKSWGKFFHLDQMEHYFVYKKNDEF